MLRSKRLLSVALLLLMSGVGSVLAVPRSTPSTGREVAATGAVAYGVQDVGHMQPTCMNNKGHIAGLVLGPPVPRTIGPTAEACLWKDGHLTRLGTLPLDALEDFANSRATAINQDDTVVGTSGQGNALLGGLAQVHPFVYEKGQLNAIEPPRTPSDRGSLIIGEALGLNDSGQIVGSLDCTAGFSAIKGQFTRLKALNTRSSGNGSRGTAVNRKGQVCGASSVNTASGGQVIHAVLWRQVGDAGVDLGTLPGRPHSCATALNDNSQVVGYSVSSLQDRNTSHTFVDDERVPIVDEEAPASARAWLWSGGHLEELPRLAGDVSSVAHSINARGYVVGRSGSHAVLWKDGRVVDLNSLIPSGSGWVLRDAVAINDANQIVVVGSLKTQKREAALLTPSTGAPAAR
jgi:uncharacterized membrane protein